MRSALIVMEHSPEVVTGESRKFTKLGAAIRAHRNSCNKVALREQSAGGRT